MSGYSPTHILCYKSDLSLSLTKFLAKTNLGAFNVAGNSNDIYPLHIVATYYGGTYVNSGYHSSNKKALEEYNEGIELLKALVQLDRSIVKERTDDNQTPLAILCGRKLFKDQLGMVKYMIEVDHSAEVVEDAIVSLSRWLTQRLLIVKMKM